MAPHPSVSISSDALAKSRCTRSAVAVAQSRVDRTVAQVLDLDLHLQPRERFSGGHSGVIPPA